MGSLFCLLLLGSAACSGGTAAAPDGSTATGQLSAGTGPTEPATVLATGFDLGAPEDLAFDTEGNLYVSEYGSDRVLMVDPEGAIVTVAHTGSPGFSGDGGAAIDAQLASPTGLAFDPAGNLMVADHFNNRIRVIDAEGIITTIAGTGEDGSNGDGGPALDAELNDPIGIAFDGDGNLFIADEQNGRVRMIDSDGIITTVAGGGPVSLTRFHDGDPTTTATLLHPSYVAIDADGNLLVSDFAGNAVWIVDPAGSMRRLAGTGATGFSGDGGPAVEAELEFPTGLALDDLGNLYVSDADNNRVRMIDRRGVITTIAGTGEAGSAGLGGPAMEAQLAGPAGLAIGPDGLLYIADQGNDRVLRIDGDGNLQLVAGSS